MEIYFQLVRDAEGLRSACEELGNARFLGFDVETTDLDPYKGDLRLVQLSDGANTKVIDLKAFGGGGSLAADPALDPLRELLASAKQTKIAHNAKFDTKWVRHHLGTEVGGIYDTYLASILISAGEGERRHGLADVVQYFLGRTLDKSEQVSDWGADELSQSQVEYAAKDAAIMPEVREKLEERITADGLTEVLRLENECVMPIAEMELNGFYLDRERWQEQLDKVRVLQKKAGDELQDMLAAGVAQASLFGRTEINLDSQAQVTDALLNLGVPMPNTTRAWELQPLAEKYPVVAKLLEYRSVAKAAQSFGDNILEFIEPKTGRIHADFRQIGAPTGRFSCSSPNLQQIPHEAEYRRCFRAPDGRKLVIADYSQIELRIVAGISGDPNMCQAFKDGTDIHTATAARVYNVPVEEVTKEMRYKAKSVNFGIIYGQGAFGLADNLGISRTEAKEIIDNYKKEFPGIQQYMDNTINFAREQGYVETLMGRKRWLRDINSSNFTVRGFAERNAINSPIQGTAADMIKLAMQKVHAAMKKAKMKSRMILQVHDELVFDALKTEVHELKPLILENMESALLLPNEVPVIAECGEGKNWLEAH